MRGQQKNRFEFSTEAFAAAERFGRFHDLYSQGSDAVELNANSPVSADVSMRPMDGLVLFERRLMGVGTERLAPRVRLNQFDHFTLQLNLAGDFHGEGAEGFRRVRAGDVLLLDMGRPMRTRTPHAHLIATSISRLALVSAGLPIDRLHGLIIPAIYAASLARLLHGLICGDIYSGVADEIANHIGQALQAMGLVDRIDPGELGADGMRRAVRYIRDRLWDDALSPEQIARAAGLSRATLYRRFELEGGVRRFIQSQRLARLRHGLTDPTDARSVTDLMYDAGFGSDAHASRSFKKAFGVSPSVFRREMIEAAESEFGPRAHDIKQQLVKGIANLA